MKETDVQKAICDYLSYKKHFFWRTNNIPIYDPKRKTYRAMPKYSIHGVPDIILIGEIGQFIGLEVKTSKGKQSKHQKEFEKNCKEAGGEYYIIKSIDDIQEIGL